MGAGLGGKLGTLTALLCLLIVQLLFVFCQTGFDGLGLLIFAGELSQFLALAVLLAHQGGGLRAELF